MILVDKNVKEGALSDLVEVRGFTTYPLIEPISKITFCNIINLQNY